MNTPQEPPYPIGAENNCKRAGWYAYFAGHGRDDCPYPAGRDDLWKGFREGWNAAAQAPQPPLAQDAPEPLSERREKVARLVRLAMLDNPQHVIGHAERAAERDRLAHEYTDQILALPPHPQVPEGYVLVPTRPSAQQLADMMLYVVANEPGANDFAMVGAVLELLPPTGHPDARNVIADMIRAYRAMISSRPTPSKG